MTIEDVDHKVVVDFLQVGFADIGSQRGFALGTLIYVYESAFTVALMDLI